MIKPFLNITIAVIIATHITYDNQINLLKNCIQSIINQSEKPNKIFLSISYNKKYSKEIKILIDYLKNIDIIEVVICIQERLSQMKHWYNIAKTGYINKYDLITFCDDDDTYKNNRIHRLKGYYNKAKYMNISGIKELSYFHEHNSLNMISELNELNELNKLNEFNYINVLNKNKAPEVWGYALIPIIFINFFNKYEIIKSNEPKNYGFDNNYGDMYFRIYLKYKMGLNFGAFGDHLYNYNTDNQNSITNNNTIDANILNFAWYSSGLEKSNNDFEDEFKKFKINTNSFPKSKQKKMNKGILQVKYFMEKLLN